MDDSTAFMSVVSEISNLLARLAARADLRHASARRPPTPPECALHFGPRSMSRLVLRRCGSGADAFDEDDGDCHRHHYSQ